MSEQISNSKKEVVEQIIKPKIGGIMLLVILALFVLSTVGFIYTIYRLSINEIPVAFGVFLLIVDSLLLFVVAPIMCAGLKVINPNEALVLTLFGKYYGTIATEGFYYVNPFCTGNNPASRTHPTVHVQVVTPTTTTLPVSKKISLKAMTLNNEKQKVNDEDGNPIEIGVIVIWQIVNAAKAVFNVDNYLTFVSTQCDSAIRHVARCYPYDVSSQGDEKSLRGSSVEIAEVLKNELQSRTEIAGIEILEAKISHLAYAPEIAAAMLQRQQASAVIAARQKIVEGAVGMVEMALNKLSEKQIVVLDDERRAQMVTNLLVVLCANKEAQPIVNSGSIF
ncbi:MAG: SPFH domain-containing protein [Vallitaleaceae bacterium]|nr:SPFH domain-containing protein [Vallitaleaceae bacterium]